VFKGVRLLVVDDDAGFGLGLKRIAEAMQFDVRIAHTISEALDIVTGKTPPDVLLLDWHLNGGNHKADVVLDRWVAHSGGPVCVISEALSSEMTQELIVRGAYNVLNRPLPPDVTQAVLMRYGKAVLEQKARETMIAKIEDLERTIRRLKIAVYTLGFVVAAVGGVEALPWLDKMLPFL
jgi:DNA-binding NtrC family response regulator